MKTCSFCSAESSTFDLFCGKCGRPFGEVPKGLPEVTKLSQSSMPVVTPPPLNNERNTDENQMVLSDVALPSVLAEQGHFPTGTAPEVQSTPHIENVPTVQGTPHVAGHSLLEQTTAQNLSSAATPGNVSTMNIRSIMQSRNVLAGYIFVDIVLER